MNNPTIFCENPEQARRMEQLIYKTILFENLKSLISCTVEKQSQYFFMDKELREKTEFVPLNELL